MDEILQELVPVMKKQFPRRPPSNENLYDYYMSRVKYNLHVALCFSPVSFYWKKFDENNQNICVTGTNIVKVFAKHYSLFLQVGEKFRSRSLKFPGLISGCTMDWFQRWPKDALIAVSTHFLAEYPIVCTDNVKTAVMGTMGEFQVYVY